METFTATGKRYKFELLAKFSPAGKDRSCVTVKIASEDGNSHWIGQTDVANSAMGDINSHLAERLTWAFEYYDLTTIPNRFEIPGGIPQTDDALPHRCTVRSSD